MTCNILLAAGIVVLALAVTVAVWDTGNNGRHRRSLWRRIWERINA